MNAAHAHLLLTHMPVLGTLFGLLLLVLGLVQRNQEVQRCSLVLFVISGLGVVPAYLTGEPAANAVMSMMSGMGSDAGDRHADIALLALGPTALLGAMGLAGLARFAKVRVTPRWFTAVVLLLSLLAACTLSWTAHLGARIRHPEIRRSFTSPPP